MHTFPLQPMIYMLFLVVKDNLVANTSMHLW